MFGRLDSDRNIHATHAGVRYVLRAFPTAAIWAPTAALAQHIKGLCGDNFDVFQTIDIIHRLAPKTTVKKRINLRGEAGNILGPVQAHACHPARSFAGSWPFTFDDLTSLKKLLLLSSLEAPIDHTLMRLLRPYMASVCCTVGGCTPPHIPDTWKAARLLDGKKPPRPEGLTPLAR